MRESDFPAAWAVNDAVLAARDPRTRDDPALPYHLRWVWDGTPPDNRDVLVRCYHGLGDTLQFSRYLPLLALRARTLTVETQPELLSFLRPLVPGATLVPFHPAHPLPPAPCTLEVMEAGHALRCLPPPIPAPATPPPRAIPLRVGLCWAGGGWDPARSVPPALLAPLAPLPGIHWSCLQQDATVHPFGPPLPRDGAVADTAVLLRTLHLVVTVDTMIAHLAGTLGVSAMLLLKAEPDWRWLPRGSRSPWYPSLRLYRQPAENRWEPVLDAVARDLSLAQTGAWEELGPSNDSTAPV